MGWRARLNQMPRVSLQHDQETCIGRKERGRDGGKEEGGRERGRKGTVVTPSYCL